MSIMFEKESGGGGGGGGESVICLGFGLVVKMSTLYSDFVWWTKSWTRNASVKEEKSF